MTRKSSRSRWFADQAIFIGFCLTFVLILGACSLFYSNTRSFIETNHLVEHTHDVIEEVQEATSALKDAATAGRTFALTDDQRFLEFYDRSIKNVNSHFANVKQLTVDNPNQQQKLDQLLPLVQAKLDSLSQAVRERQNGNLTEDQNISAIKNGKAQTDQIRDLIDQLKQEEHRLLNLRIDQTKKSQLQAILTFGSFCFLVSTLFIVNFVVIRRNNIERQRVEAEQTRLLAVLESSSDFIGIANRPDQVVYVNRAGRKLFGLKDKAEIDMSKIRESHPEWALKIIRDQGIPIAERTGAWLGETALIDVHNNEIPVSLLITAHKNEHGETAFYSMVSRNIAAQKQAELALRASERRCRDLIDKSLGFITTHALDGTILSINQSAAAALGFEQNDLIGHSINDFMAARMQSFFNDYLEQIKVNQEASGIMIVRHKSGEERIWQFSNVLYHEEGKEPYVLGHAQDITELKRAEKELRESRKLFQEFMNNSPAMNFMKDEAGRMVFINEPMEKLFNVRLEDLRGQTDFYYLPQEIAEEVRLNDQKVLETGQTLATIEIVPTPDGKMRHWQSYKFLINNNNDQKFVGGVAFDISELKNAQESLRESKLFAENVTEHSTSIIYVFDLNRMTNVYSNRNVTEFLGCSHEEIEALGENFLPSIVHPEDLPFTLQHLDEFKTVADDQVIEFEQRTRHASGEWRWLWIRETIFKRDANGVPIQIMGTAQDITDRKEMEAEIKKTRDEAVQSARVKAEFLANMSHEIRTPMNGVIGMTDLLLNTQLDKSQREYSKTIRNSAESLLQVINDILDFSKIEAGKLGFETIDFDIHNTLESTVELFAEQVQSKNIEFAYLIETDVPTDLCGDPGRLRQVLNNLISNAIKFTNEGEVVVNVAKESETEEDVLLNFKVVDTGIGIEGDTCRNLFQAFTQADNSTTRKFGGTGLGLAISRQLVEMMNGTIGVESEFGKGSTFSFTARFKKSLQTIAKTKARTDLKGLRVLIVDDNATNRKILTYQVASWGMVAFEAGDAATALAMLRDAAKLNRAFDLALLDLQMPTDDGFELARKIKNERSIADTQLILMPSYGMRGHGLTAQQIGISGYLVKPVRQSDLFECIANVTGERANALDNSSDIKKTDELQISSAELITKHKLTELRSKTDEQILVAEDNLVNQKVVKSQLERLGYSVEVVENGYEALAALDRETYSLILMDCQMPKMDGYAAATEIRRRESALGMGRLPIIALTAHAMQGEREKCLAAGMDDYLAKPFKQNELAVMVKNWLKLESESSENVFAINDCELIDKRSQIETSTTASDVTARINEFHAEVGEEAANSIVELFLEDSLARLDALRAAIKEKDFTDLKRQAHGLKGSGGNVGAKRLAELCSELEIKANSENSIEATVLIAKIEAEMATLHNILSRSLKEILTSDAA